MHALNGVTVVLLVRVTLSSLRLMRELQITAPAEKVIAALRAEGFVDAEHAGAYLTATFQNAADTADSRDYA